MRTKRLAIGVVATALLTLGLHYGARRTAAIAPPAGIATTRSLATSNGVRQVGRSFATTIGKLRVVKLMGSPEEIGESHALLMHDEMVRTEAVVWELLDRAVPNPLARLLLLDTGGIAYRHVDQGFGDAGRRELAASALAFRPDPFAERFAAFQRFVYLAALYDISLAYEHSPLLGCTTFTFSGNAAAGSPILARAFDFDVHDVFDEEKVVFLVSPDGGIPFASVAWAGLVGVVSGMNREGLAVVVHGARAGPTRTVGEPVVEELRRVLTHARTTSEAVKLLSETEPLVSHMDILSDAAGHAVVVERIPGATPFVRELGEKAAVTNHLEGPSASDPKNARVRAESSTLPRRARGDELIASLERPATAADAVRLLRDRNGAAGEKFPLGDRRAIDALIATHGVVMETGTKRLWVSEAPHLLGRFVAFDLERLLAADAAPNDVRDLPSIPADPMLENGEWARFRAGAQ